MFGNISVLALTLGIPHSLLLIFDILLTIFRYNAVSSLWPKCVDDGWWSFHDPRASHIWGVSRTGRIQHRKCSRNTKVPNSGIALPQSFYLDSSWIFAAQLKERTGPHRPSCPSFTFHLNTALVARCSGIIALRTTNMETATMSTRRHGL